MTSPIETLSILINEKLSGFIHSSQIALNELTLDVAPQHIQQVGIVLRDDPDFEFNMLMDVCGVDYSQYGLSEWETESTTETGFERGVDVNTFQATPNISRSRFAAVYHLLSTTHNHRVRLKAYLDSTHPTVPTVVPIWPSANWFEREAFDLFGIHFTDHPDLRRLLTDYGFIGHPFRKDFPLIGHLEARYDAALKQVVYEPVSIKPRILEPKVIRHDNRYESENK